MEDENKTNNNNKDSNNIGITACPMSMAIHHMYLLLAVVDSVFTYSIRLLCALCSAHNFGRLN